MVKLETTTARENELLSMIFEKNRTIEQLVKENESLKREKDKLTQELQSKGKGADG